MTGVNTPELGELLQELGERRVTCRLTDKGKLLVHPRSRLNKKLLKRIKKHKQGIIAMLRLVAEYGPPICPACLQEIPDSDPHITLERYDTGEQKHFHNHPACMTHAMAKVASEEERGEVFLMHLMHACDDGQAGFACSGGCFRG